MNLIKNTAFSQEHLSRLAWNPASSTGGMKGILYLDIEIRIDKMVRHNWENG